MKERLRAIAGSKDKQRAVRSLGDKELYKMLAYAHLTDWDFATVVKFSWDDWSDFSDAKEYEYYANRDGWEDYEGENGEVLSRDLFDLVMSRTTRAERKALLTFELYLSMRRSESYNIK